MAAPTDPQSSEAPAYRPHRDPFAASSQLTNYADIGARIAAAEGDALTTKLADDNFDRQITLLNDRIETIAYGLDVATYRPADSQDASGSDDDRCLLTLGPIHPVIGIVPLLKSFAMLGMDNEGWRIVVAGEPCGSWRKPTNASPHG